MPRMNRRIASSLLAASVRFIGAAHVPYEFSEESPRVVYRHLLPADSTAGSRSPTRAIVFVDREGYVARVRFRGTPPADSIAVASAARRWIFDPGALARLGIDGVWISIPYTIVRPSPEKRPAERPSRTMIAAGVAGFRMAESDSATAFRLEPPRDGFRESPPKFRDPEFAGSFVQESRVVSAHTMARMIEAIAADSTFGAVSVSDCDAEPDLALRFSGGATSTDVFLNLACGFLQVRSGSQVILVPVPAQHERLRALAHALFPRSFDSPRPATRSN